MLNVLTAGKKAAFDAGLTEDVMKNLDKSRCGVLVGSAMGGMQIFSDAIEALRISYCKMDPFCVPFATTNMGSAVLAMDLGLCRGFFVTNEANWYHCRDGWDPTTLFPQLVRQATFVY